MCGRCPSPDVVATIEIFVDVEHVVVNLCGYCTAEHAQFITTRPSAQDHLLARIDTSTFDDVLHTATCRCAECEPDIRHDTERIAS